MLSIGAAYLATLCNNIRDLLQLVFGFVNAPLLATFAVTVLVSVMTRFKPAGELKGLVYGLTEMPSREGLK